MTIFRVLLWAHFDVEIVHYLEHSETHGVLEFMLIDFLLTHDLDIL